MNGRRPGGARVAARAVLCIGVPLLSVCLCLYEGKACAEGPSLDSAETPVTEDPTSAPASEEEAQARLFFEAAKLAYDAEQYAQAAELFEQVYELSPHPFMLINLASAYRHLDDQAREAEALQRYLQTSGDEADPAYVQRFEQLIDALAAKLPRRDRRRLLKLEASVLEGLPPMPHTPMDGPTTHGVASHAPSLWQRYRAAWLTLGGTVATSGSALALWVSTRSTYDSLLRACRSDAGCSMAAIDQVASRTRATRTLATLGLVAGATTVTLFALPTKAESGERASRTRMRAQTKLVWRGASLGLQSAWR